MKETPYNNDQSKLKYVTMYKARLYFLQPVSYYRIAIHKTTKHYLILLTQVQFYTLRRMALAFTLLMQMLKFENKSKDVCDLGSDLWIASLAATCARKFEASLPQAP